MPPRSDPNPSSSSPDLTIVAIVFILMLGIFGVFFNAIFTEYNNAVGWFYSQKWKEIFTIIRRIIITADVFLAVFIVFTLRRLLKLQKKEPEEKAAIHVIPPKEIIREAWEGIQALANSKNPSDWNMAILRADALLDDVLRDLGYEGDTIVDRLKIVDTNKLKSIEHVWSAHRLRNIIAHDPVTQHMQETIDHAIRSYAHAFRELELLEEKH